MSCMLLMQAVLLLTHWCLTHCCDAGVPGGSSSLWGLFFFFSLFSLFKRTSGDHICGIFLVQLISSRTTAETRPLNAIRDASRAHFSLLRLRSGETVEMSTCGLHVKNTKHKRRTCAPFQTSNIHLLFSGPACCWDPAVIKAYHRVLSAALGGLPAKR